MKFGRFEIHRASAAEEPARRAPKEMGSSGTLNYSGYLQQEEYNPELAGERGLDVFDRMQRSDGAVAETYGHISAPILNAQYPIEAGGQEEIDLELRAFAEHAFFDWLEQPWLEVLDQVLDYPVFGHAVFETPCKIVEHELEYELPGQWDVGDQSKRTPKKVVVPRRQFVTWERFAPRLQRTIYKWNVDRGKLLSITQHVYGTAALTEVTIPAEQLLVFTNRKRGDDFTGRSLLRPAYKHWWLKELLEKVGVLAAMRHGIGVWIAYPPASKANDEAVAKRLEEILTALGSEEKTPYIVAPGPKATATVDGWWFEIAVPAGGIPDFEPLLQYHRGEIKGAVLVRFSELGHGQTGARATGDTQSQVWYDALHGVASYICEVFNVALKRLIDLNYPGVERYPKLTVANIEARNLTEFADAHYKLVQCKAIEPDATYRAAVREFVDMPPEDEEQEKPAPPAAPPPNVITIPPAVTEGLPIEPPVKEP